MVERTSGSGVFRPLLTIPQVAKILNVTRPTVYKMIYTEGLPTIPLGRAVRVAPASLERWIGNKEQVN